jgi:hypothetical protein
MLAAMRRAAARLLAIAVVACGIVPLTAGASWACSCAAPTLNGAALDRSIARSQPLIYTAEVVSVTGNSSGYEYDVLVQEALKGTVEEQRTLTTGLGGGDCGVRLEEGAQLLIYSDEGSLGTCGGFMHGAAADLQTHVRNMRAVIPTPGTIVLSRQPSPASTPSLAAAAPAMHHRPMSRWQLALFAFAAAAVLSAGAVTWRSTRR